MPMYEYVCAGCQSEFQLRRRRMDAKKKVACPECGAAAKRRITDFQPKSRD